VAAVIGCDLVGVAALVKQGLQLGCADAALLGKLTLGYRALFHRRVVLPFVCHGKFILSCVGDRLSCKKAAFAAALFVQRDFSAAVLA